MRYREVAGKLKRLGCEELPRKGKGSHKKWHNPSTGKSSVIPDWGSKDLKTGTVKAVLKQLGIEWEDFEKS